MADDTKKPTRAENTRVQRVTKDVIEKRVRAVGEWLVQGHRARRIYLLVSEATKLERERRQTARAKSPPEPPPPFVWGDIDPPCSTRMIDVYVRKARDKFEAEGRELSKKGVEVLGITWARSNDLYWRALAAERYATCRMILRDQMEMFGLIGAIKVQLVEPGTASGAGAPDTSHLPETSMTVEQINAEYRALIEIGLLRARQNGGTMHKVAHALGPGEPVNGNGTDSRE